MAQINVPTNLKVTGPSTIQANINTTSLLKGEMVFGKIGGGGVM